MDIMSPSRLTQARALKRQWRQEGRVNEMAKDCVVKEDVVREEEVNDYQEFWDDMSGQSLDAKKVRLARQQEMQYVKQHQLYVKVPESQAWSETGKGPIGTRWVDVNKGTEENPDYRSRLVAQEIKTDKRQELFAATPPLEAKKMLFPWR